MCGRSFVVAVVLMVVTPSAYLVADIYRWDNDQLIPGTEGVTPGPGVILDHHELAYAELSEIDLTGSRFEFSNLTSARFNRSTLTNAVLSGATVTAASFVDTTSRGFTAAQLYSTKSYQDKDMSGIVLVRNDLVGWDFSGQNLTRGSLYSSTLTNANLTGAVVTGNSFVDTTIRGFTAAQLYSTKSYQGKNLSGVGFSVNDLTGWDFREQNLTEAAFHSSTLRNANLAGANLTNAILTFSTLTNANLTGAVVAGTSFYDCTIRGFTAAQLYSTKSYQDKNLSAIGLRSNNLTGWDFREQNLTNANFDSSMLMNANLAGANLTSANLASSTFTNASLAAANLTNASLASSTLTNASLVGANLTNANLDSSTLTNAGLGGAVVTGTTFGSTTSSGFTAAQLYSTKSYQDKYLSAIGLRSNNLTGWDFREQNLTNARFDSSTLTNANVAGAVVTGTGFTRTTSRGFTAAQLYSTKSYQDKNLEGIILVLNNLAGWNFREQNLTNAYLSFSTLTNADLSGVNLTNADLNSSTLTNANLSGAVVTGTTLASTTALGFLKNQLYSTLSYQEKNLSAIGLRRNDLTGWDFSQQNLANADFDSSTLANADLSGADTRGAKSLFLGGATSQNTILPEGNIAGLVLVAGQKLVVRDEDGVAEPATRSWLTPRDPIPVTIQSHMTMTDGGFLELRFEADPWDSLISFEPRIPVQLGGTLELVFADDVDVASQVGRTMRIFDWTDVTPTGQFQVASPYTWNLTNLYTAGEVTLTGIHQDSPCDFDRDGDCDVRDVNALMRVGNLAIGVAEGNPQYDRKFDLTDDQIIDGEDLARWLADAATENGWAEPFMLGDTDLNGQVDFADFVNLNNNWQQTQLLDGSSVAWQFGDFNGDKIVDFTDFVAQNNNWQRMNTAAGAAAVPEPSTFVTTLLMLLSFVERGRRHLQNRQ